MKRNSLITGAGVAVMAAAGLASGFGQRRAGHDRP